MGLDFVELVLTVEEAFDVRLSDERVGAIVTVGDLYDHLVELKGPVAPSRSRCLSAAAFFRLRRAYCRLHPVVSKPVHPRHALDDLLPRAGRRDFWRRLREEVRLILPPLVRPRWLVTALTLLVFSTAAVAALSGWQAWGPGLGALVGLATLGVAGMGAAMATLPLARCAGSGFATFGELSRYVAAHNHAALATDPDAWNREDLWDSLRLIVAEQLGLKPEDVMRDAHFGDMT